MSAASVLVKESDGQFMLSGAVDFDTVPVLLEQSQREFAPSGAVSVSWANVAQINSAALALLVEWMSWQADGRLESIAFAHLPEQLHSLASACGVDELLQAHSHVDRH